MKECRTRGRIRVEDDGMTGRYCGWLRIQWINIPEEDCEMMKRKWRLEERS